MGPHTMEAFLNFVCPCESENLAKGAPSLVELV